MSRFTARMLTVAGLILLGVLLMSGPQAAAVPPQNDCPAAQLCRPPGAQPRPAPVPTPNRIDTGGGPMETVNWWLVVVPALGLLGSAATGAHLWIVRSERGAR